MNIQTLLTGILTFLNDVIVPFLLALAGLVFLWNAFRYFIIGGSNEEDQTRAKSLALWGITAFVIMISLWGIVNLLVAGLGFGGYSSLLPDYV